MVEEGEAAEGELEGSVEEGSEEKNGDVDDVAHVVIVTYLW